MLIDIVQPLGNLGRELGRVKLGDVHPDQLILGESQPLVTGAIDIPDGSLHIEDHQAIGCQVKQDAVSVFHCVIALY